MNVRRLPPVLTLVKVALASVSVALLVASCGGDRAGDGTRTRTEALGPAESDVAAFVTKFMETRQAGRAADKFLTAKARRAFDEHANGGVWLYDDTLPGGPGGEYRDFSVGQISQASKAPSWHAFVEIDVQWNGDVPPGRISERLTIGTRPSGRLVVRNARRTGDPADSALPIEVAIAREAIYRAAVAHDYEALRSLLDPKTFSYSFGGSGDPIGYWREQEAGHLPLIGDILPRVLHSRFARADDVYMWPSAAAKDPASWTGDDVEAMRELGHTDREIRRFEEFGGYSGWRAGIRADGTWLFFIAGD
jgi:hypothetical protein